MSLGQACCYVSPGEAVTKGPSSAVPTRHIQQLQNAPGSKQLAAGGGTGTPATDTSTVGPRCCGFPPADSPARYHLSVTPSQSSQCVRRRLRTSREPKTRVSG